MFAELLLSFFSLLSSLDWSIIFILIPFTVITISFSIWYLICVYPKWKLISKIPGPNLHPLLGNLDFVISNSIKYHDWPQKCFNDLIRFSNTYGKDGIFRFSLGSFGHNCLFLTRPETIEQVLGNPDLVEKAFFYRLFKSFLGNGLGTSDGQRWKYNRKLLNPAFHYRVLEDFLPILNDTQNIFLEVIDKKCEENNGVIDDIRPIVSKYVLDTLCETAMGVKLQSQIKVDTEPEYTVILRKLFEIGLYIIVRPWFWSYTILNRSPIGIKGAKYLKTLHDFTDNVIRKRKEELISLDSNQTNNQNDNEKLDEKPKKNEMPFLDLVLRHHLKNPTLLKEYHVRAEVDTFMFAGHHTTASSLDWTLHLIGSHPHVQERIHQELDELRDLFGGQTKTLTLDKLRQFKYLECVIKESLRLYPTAPIIARKTTKPFKCGGYDIPIGTTMAIFIYHVQRHKDYFPEPDKFIPERFLSRSEWSNDKRHPYSFIPFSAGLRNCIGQKYSMMQMRAVLAALLNKYTITSLDEADTVVVGLDFVLAPKSPIRIKFQPRIKSI